MEKIKKENWNLATIHFLVGGIAIPLATYIILVIILVLLGMLVPQIKQGIEQQNGIYYLLLIVGYVVVLLSIWLGVIRSSQSIARKYIVADKNKVVKLSTLYLVIASFILQIAGGQFNIIFALVYLILAGAIFYFASLKYLPNSETDSYSI